MWSASRNAFCGIGDADRMHSVRSGSRVGAPNPSPLEFPRRIILDIDRERAMQWQYCWFYNWSSESKMRGKAW